MESFINKEKMIMIESEHEFPDAPTEDGHDMQQYLQLIQGTDSL